MNAEFGTSSPDLSSPLLATADASLDHAVATQACQLALESLSELVSLMIHDLANPLQSLTMQLELAGDPNDSDASLDIDSMLQTSEEVGALLNKISGFFYQRGAPAPCQLRAGLNRLQGIMLHRLASRGIAWECTWLDLPELPHRCIIAELVLLRCLILVGYQPRQDRSQRMTLKSTLLLTEPFCAQNPVDLRIHLELLDQQGSATPLFTPEKSSSLELSMQRLGSGFAYTALANNRVQLDFRLPCPPQR